MRTDLNYQGLTFTDALEMQGVKKFFPDGAASVQSLIAGNDMLCLPGDVPVSVQKIKDAIADQKLSWDDIAEHCKKVLMVKYEYGLAHLLPINTENLTADLNKDVPAMRRTVAENAITLVAKTDPSFFPLRDTTHDDIAFIGFGISADNDMATRMRDDYHAAVFYFSSNGKYNDSLVARLKNFKKVIIGIHGLTRYPANNFGLTKDMADMIRSLQQGTNNISFLFANAYALKNMCAAPNMVVCYEDDPVVQNTAADLLEGKLFYKGVLPVTVCESLTYGFGIQTASNIPLFEKDHAVYNENKLLEIDSVANDAIAKHATPGCVVLALKNGKIAYEKAFGGFTYENNEPVTLQTVYDLASLTKVFATTLSVMKLYEEGKLDLKKKLGNYLPETIGTDKQDILIEKLLIHEAGLEAFIPFYKETVDAAGKPLPFFYRPAADDSFSIPVAAGMFMRNTWSDTIYKRILCSKKGPEGNYLYSDNDFIFLGKIVERISGKSLDEYASENFYGPMQLHSIGFRPLERNDIGNIAPTENEKAFRTQLLRGYVHDPGAAMMGGVAGHAGLFSDAYDLAAIMQMLLNGGIFNNRQYFKKETIALFTAYHGSLSRRGYGFDKPEKDNTIRKDPYPAISASPAAFGHTGFTGTCAWADSAAGMVYIFLSNRLYPSGSNLLLNMNVRGKICELFYKIL